MRRSGLGTRRLLAVAMQREAAAASGLTVVDEFEHGLEPHRIRRLLRVLRGKPPETQTAGGQLLLTTHSSTVLSELAPEEVFVVRRSADGSVLINSVPAAVGYVLRRAPEALLSRKVVVAEGATEEGLCQALDEAWTDEDGVSFAYRGVAIVDGRGGTQPAEIAGYLHALGYEVALLVDSDAKAKVHKAAGATLLAWPDGLCTEQRLARDLPMVALQQMAVMAANTARKGQRSVRDAIADGLGVSRSSFGDDPAGWVTVVREGDFREALGSTAKQDKHSWFKSRDLGRFLGRLIVEHWNEIKDTPTRNVVAGLRCFVHDA